MKKTNTRLNKVISLFLVISVVASMFVGVNITASAAQNPNYSKSADGPTLDGWKQFFGTENPTTENAGGVWTDKSVFTDGTSFTGLTDAYNRTITPTVADDSFLVALSAIASNKSIVGYSHMPTDTIFVLDVSSSMGPGSGYWNNDAIAELVQAANVAITTLLELNQNNRIGVVLYASNTYQFLPIDRYTATQTVANGEGTVSKFFETNNSRNQVIVSNGVKNSSGTDIIKTQNVQSGTYIQGGLGLAADMFKEKYTDGDTLVDSDKFQGGTQRKPVIVLMSDGAPSVGTTQYTDPGSYTLGQGATSEEIYAFLTQLTAAYVRQEVAGYYGGSEPMFYTLGFKVGNDAVATSVLDPKNSVNQIDTMWQNFSSASNGATVQLSTGRNGVSVVKNSAVQSNIYNDGYFSADTNVDLTSAFDRIVSEIIIQSLYRPTLVEQNNAHMEGYIEFIDDIGDYMKVEQIEGIMIGNKLYTGEKLSENFRESGGELGTVTNPSALGDNFVWSVKERLGISDTAEARQLIGLAYEAGQLSYVDHNNYSNYIGWYADEDGKYIGFWKESHTYADIPTGAKYINKSYGMLGEIADGYNISDLMYVSIQVHTEIVSQNTFNSEDSDVIMPGHAQVIFRVPASLIPVVTYNVELEGTSYADARNVQMTVKDAEPIRLLFEVGLRNDINEYNIEAALGSNNRVGGKYVFYTNEHSVDQFNHKTDDDPNTYVAPTEAINTIAYFEPSYENERYYYTEPTPVYIKQGETYVKYNSATKPEADDGNEYYRQINVFELTAATNDGNAAEHHQIYERISDKAIGRVVANANNNGWDIPKETIHRVYDEIVEKGEKENNITDTLDYAYYPTVEHIEGTHYYADAILGNNGKLTVTPATGLSITKKVDETLLGTDETFTFNVKIGSAQAEYDVVRKDATGMFVKGTETIALDSNGEGTLTLKADETALIVGVPKDQSYAVTEGVPVNAEYKVLSKTNDTGTITEYSLAQVEFTNTIAKSGNLIISKNINYPFADVPDSLNTHTFEFTAELSKGNESYNSSITAHYSTNPTATFPLYIDNNKLYVDQDKTELITLHGNQAIIIEIEEGWEVEVTENTTNMPSGFAQNVQQTVIPANTTIDTNANVVYGFVNDYTPQAVSPDITIKASKEFTGRPWNANDSFTFGLYKYNTATASYDEIATETISESQKDSFGATLTNAIKLQSFDKVGTYNYAIMEIAPSETKGITYDNNFRDFNIVVTDQNTTGKLEILEVTGGNHAAVAKSGDEYTVTADKFVNRYKASGNVEVTLDIEKTVDTPTGITYSPKDFEFGIYDLSGALVSPLHLTDEQGKTHFILSYDASGVSYNNDKVSRYVIKETNTNLAGVTYANEIPLTVTVKDNLDGTIVAKVEVESTETTTVRVVNYYNPNAAKVTLTATKTITGRDLVEGEFKFDLYNVDTNAVEQDDVALALQPDGTGLVTFAELTFNNVGTYNYLVYEDEVNEKGVTVDTNRHEVKITVTDDNSGQLKAKVEVNGVENGDIAFANTYKADATNIEITATKELNGRELADKEFGFELYQNGNLLETAYNDLNGNVKFTAIPVDTVGEYTFTVNELKGEAEGVTYDESEYTVTAKVTDNLDGTLKVEYAYSKATETVEGIAFINTYLEPEQEQGNEGGEGEVITEPEPEDEPEEEQVEEPQEETEEPTEEPTEEQPETETEQKAPQTGEKTNLALWLAVLFISGSTLFGTSLFGKKKKQTDN